MADTERRQAPGSGFITHITTRGIPAHKRRSHGFGFPTPFALLPAPGFASRPSWSATWRLTLHHACSGNSYLPNLPRFVLPVPPGASTVSGSHVRHPLLRTFSGRLQLNRWAVSPTPCGFRRQKIPKTLDYHDPTFNTYQNTTASRTRHSVL